MLVPTILDLSENHWHKIIQESMVALKSILYDIDGVIFSQIERSNMESPEKYVLKQSQEQREILDHKWDKLDSMLKSGDSEYDKPHVPFSSSNLIMEFNPLYKKVYDKEKFMNT